MFAKTTGYLIGMLGRGKDFFFWVELNYWKYWGFWFLGFWGIWVGRLGGLGGIFLGAIFFWIWIWIWKLRAIF